MVDKEPAEAEQTGITCARISRILMIEGNFVILAPELRSGQLAIFFQDGTNSVITGTDKKELAMTLEALPKKTYD